jgi:hypothetical protein
MLGKGFQDGDYREEAESLLPKVNSGEMPGTHLAGKTTKKRQNSNTSTHPAHT